MGKGVFLGRRRRRRILLRAAPKTRGSLPGHPFRSLRAQGGGKVFQERGLVCGTPPYLECPSAVFLEELETGAIECHVSDAAGEEFLEYSWEPVGSTTRDYLDNPKIDSGGCPESVGSGS